MLKNCLIPVCLCWIKMEAQPTLLVCDWVGILTNAIAILVETCRLRIALLATCVLVPDWSIPKLTPFHVARIARTWTVSTKQSPRESYRKGKSPLCRRRVKVPSILTHDGVGVGLYLWTIFITTSR